MFLRMIMFVIGITVLAMECIGIVAAAPLANISLVSWDKPSGHCHPKCSCHMDGKYYGEGERWRNHEEPCSIYQCLKDGEYKAVARGCLYKEVCKPANKSWKDGCNTFACIVGKDNIPYYKIVEAGCLEDSGQCLKTGKTKVIGCDTFECQLIGNTLQMKKIRTGCATEGTCKSVGSYWHDGCTTYTCESTQTETVKISVSDVRMQWPDANYAIPKVRGGCPRSVPEMWTEGSRLHFGTGANSFSEVLSLEGNFSQQAIKHTFCVHTSIQHKNSSLQSSYKTFWDPGSYCIFRKHGTCPRGFNEGYILIDDNDKMTNLSNSVGQLPDGDFVSDTAFFFCCRNDSDVSSQIDLPKDDSFVLFMENQQSKCQTVSGMNHSVEFITFDGSPTSKYIQTGSLPARKLVNGDLTYYFCVYRPIDCGCADGNSGRYISLNSEKSENCQTKRCISERGTKVLKSVMQGCSVNKECKTKDAVWTVSEGDTCIKQTCAIVLNFTDIRFEVRNISAGCVDGTGKCYMVGENFTGHCYEAFCLLNKNKTFLNVTKRACEWNNTCYQHGAVWSDGCVDYKCVVNLDALQISWKVEIVKIACKDHDGNCLAVGDNTTENCLTYECVKNGNNLQLLPILVGCDFNGTCINENTTWKDEDKCVDYYCQKKTSDSGTVMQMSVVGYGCLFNNTCMDVNSTWQDGCKTRKCVVKKMETHLQRSISAISAGCDDDGICRPVGYKQFTDTCMEYECLFNDTYKDSFFNLISGSCRSLNGTCHAVGAQWIEKQKNMCIKYECRMIEDVYLQKTIEQSCLDTNDVCRPVGSTGFATMVNEKLRQDCTCIISKNNKSGLLVECKG